MEKDCTITSSLPTCPLREEKSFLKSLCDTECYVKMASIASAQFQSGLPIFKTNRNTNRNLNISKLWPLNRGYSVLIKSSKSPENKGFIAMCSPYLFIRLHTSLLFPSLLIRANTRARKSHNKNKHKCGNRRTVMYVRIYYNGGFFNGQVYLRW